MSKDRDSELRERGTVRNFQRDRNLQKKREISKFTERERERKRNLEGEKERDLKGRTEPGVLIGQGKLATNSIGAHRDFLLSENPE